MRVPLHKLLILLVALLLLAGWAPGGRAAGEAPGAEAAAAGGVRIDYMLLFGPAPLDLTSGEGRYMWAIAHIKNGGADEIVTVSAEITGAPFGCEQEVDLILPGQDRFIMFAGDEKFALYRTRYECGVCADPGVSGVDVSVCVSGATGSDCANRSRAFIVNTPVTLKRYVQSATSTAWFNFCDPLQGCLLWPDGDWFYFSQLRAAFLDGYCYGFPMRTMYLNWFAHGEYIYDQRDDSRPFDVYPLAWGTTTSLGLVNLSDHTTSMWCEDWYHPAEDGLYCSSGHVGHTYVRPTTFDGWARLQCHGPLGSDCLGLPLIEYAWTYQ